MGNLEGIEPYKKKKKMTKVQQENLAKELLKIVGDKEKNERLVNFKNDPIHDLVNFLAKNKKRKAEKILKEIRPNIKPEQYITEEQENQILQDFLKEKDQKI